MERVLLASNQTAVAGCPRSYLSSAHKQKQAESSPCQEQAAVIISLSCLLAAKCPNSFDADFKVELGTTLIVALLVLPRRSRERVLLACKEKDC